MSETETADKPEMDSEELAEIDELAEEVEQEAGVPEDSEEPTEGPERDVLAGESDVMGDIPLEDDSVTIGEIYVRGLCILSNALVEQYGDGEAPFETDSGELDTALAEQLKLDQYMDQVMAKRGGMDEMTPEQALVFSTMLFFMATITMDSGLVDNMVGEFS